MKLFLIGLAIKAVLFAVVLGVVLFFVNKEINRRVDGRLDLAIKLHEHREWKRLTRRQAADLRLGTPRDGVSREHGWHWARNDKDEYKLAKGLLAGDSEPVLTGEFEEPVSE